MRLNKKKSLTKQKIQMIYKIFSIVSVLIGIFLLCISIYYISFDINRFNNSSKTKARVQQVNFNGENYILNISYNVDNKEYKNTYVYNEESVTINEFINIRYNKNNPLDIITTNHIIKISILLPSAIIILIISITYIIVTNKNKKRIQKLKEEGIHILANIEGVFVNNNSKKKKGKLPYHIKAQYLNPQDNKMYTYISRDYYEDLLMLTSSKTITQVPIYINPKNTNDYYMDLIYILPEDDE